MNITKAVIPAAGLGTRFLPVTKALPKEMLPIVDKPAIQYIVEEAIDSGITDILVITGRGKGPIVDFYDRSPELEAYLESRGEYDLLEKIKNLSSLANIHYMRQNEPLGLGHAVSCARSFAGNEPFAVLLGDDIMKSSKPAIRQLMDAAGETQSSIIGIKEVPKREIGKYGIIRPVSFNGRVCRVGDLIEKPLLSEAPSRLAIMGRYILNSSIFDYLERVTPGSGGEIQLTDALKLQSIDEPVDAYLLEGERFDTGNKLGYIIANVEYALDSPELGQKFALYLQELSRSKGWHLNRPDVISLHKEAVSITEKAL